MADAADKPENNGEDSMEDILHSIRDIIASEGSAEDTAEGPTPEENLPEEDEDVLELTEMVEIEEAPPAESGDVLDDIDNILGTPTEEPAAIEVAEETPAEEPAVEEIAEELPAEEPAVEEIAEELPAEEPAAIEVAEETLAEEPAAVVESDIKPASLISEGSAAEATASMKSLVQSIPHPVIDSPAFRSGATVEDLVVESMKPMLAEWLNENLPTLVEEIVAREIRKLVPHEDE